MISLQRPRPSLTSTDPRSRKLDSATKKRQRTLHVCLKGVNRKHNIVKDVRGQLVDCRSKMASRNLVAR